MSRLYENMRRIIRKEMRNISILREGTDIYCTIPEIVDKLAHMYPVITTTRFLSLCIRIGSKHQQYNLNHSLTYLTISLSFFEELRYSLSHSRNLSPGEDEVTTRCSNICHIIENCTFWNFTRIFSKSLASQRDGEEQ